MNVAISEKIAPLELFPDFSPYAKEVQEQVDMLKACVSNHIPLSRHLEKIGKSYDDLIYANNPTRRAFIQRDIPSLGGFTTESNGIPAVSFFSGAGGLDLGFEVSGFSHLLLLELNELFCQTLHKNRPSWNVEEANISNIDDTIHRIEKHIGSCSSFDGVFFGGPPCQPFSIAANQRFNKNGENFKRVGFSHEKNGNLLFDFIRVISHFCPRAFMIENVPGLVDVDGGEQLKKAYKILETAGYRMCQPFVAKAELYGVPQSRTRLFIIGNKCGKDFFPPAPSAFPTPVAPIFKLSLKGVENHVTREHSAESILRYMMLDYGARDKLGRVDRLDPCLPSKTVIAGGTKGGGRSHLHPFVPRTLSVRECARIQTFPDDYLFCGPVARQFTQVGNAVPPVLGAQLATALRRSFF